MILSKQARRVIVDAIGMIQAEAAKGIIELYQTQTEEKGREILERIDAQRDYLSAVLVTYRENAQIRLSFPWAEKQNKTELEKDLEDRA